MRKKANVKSQLSVVYIVGEHNRKDLDNLFSETYGFGEEVLILNLLSDIDIHKYVPHPGKKIRIIQAPDGSDYIELITSTVRRASGDWILLLNSGETICHADQKIIRELCKKGEHQAYYLISRLYPNNSDLSQYEWMGVEGKYSGINVQKHAYIPCLAIRLFKRKILKGFLHDTHYSIQPLFSEDIKNVPLIPVQVGLHKQKEPSARVSEQKAWEEDYERFVAAYDKGQSLQKDFDFLKPENIGYSLIDEKDIPSLFAGLDMGFGNIEILRFIIHKFIDLGEYDRAIELADTFSKRLGDHIEFWRLKGSAYFYKLDLTNAEKCYRQGVSIRPNDGNLLMNLARVLIVAGKFQEAKETLQKVINIEGTNPEIEFIIDSINENKGRVAKLSLLMIAKDEEDYIARALKSVESIVDEIVVVDTGSEDRTVDEARACGARIIHHNWNDDFSEARNAGLEQVTGNYVLHLDADEFFDNEARISLLVFKSILPVDEKKGIVFDIKTFSVIDQRNKNLSPKNIIQRTAIFPTLPGIDFSGRIFESVDPSLNRIGIKKIRAENIYIIHQNKNSDFRNRRKVEALKKSFHESANIEQMLEGIFLWLRLEEQGKAQQWFESFVLKSNGNKKYSSIIGQLAHYFHKNKRLDLDSPLFNALLMNYRNSYRVMSFCSDMLVEYGRYDEAIKILDCMVYGQSEIYDDPTSEGDIRKNLLNLCVASLETQRTDIFERTLNELSSYDSMLDATRALIFYSEVKSRELERAIDILDFWIRDRHLPVKRTIDGFPELIEVITDIGELMIRYGKFDTSKILIRSAEHLANTLNMKRGGRQ